MRARGSWWIPVGVAGLLDCGMALAHFGLQWEWYQVHDFGSLAPQLQWALFALNFSWGVLLFCVGALVLHAAAAGSTDPTGRRVVLVVGTFWAIHGLYVALVPMPLPPELSWIRLPLVAFPATLVVLHVTALTATASQLRAARIDWT